MKYKLIQIQTKEEHLCDKVVIDEMEYYVTYPDNCCIQKEGRTLMNKGCMERNHCERKIATNHPNIDIPQVVDEVEILGRNILPTGGWGESIEINKERQGFVKGYNKSQETHPNSDDDMIEFKDWCFNIPVDSGLDDKNTKTLLQYWKEQKTKTLYYE